jgi:hypothetical protein
MTHSRLVAAISIISSESPVKGTAIMLVAGLRKAYFKASKYLLSGDITSSLYGAHTSAITAMVFFTHGSSTVAGFSSGFEQPVTAR